MENAHTPLPWVIDSEGMRSKIWGNFPVHEISAPNTRTHSWIAFTQTDDEGNANTQLIVAAVNSHQMLVDALKAVQTMMKVAHRQFNWRDSALDADAIRLLNEVPGIVAAALKQAGEPQSTGGKL